MASTYNDLLLDRDANETAAEFVRQRIAEIVDDPEVAELLSPRDYPFGTKRPCLDTDYYATFNRDNVILVDLRSTPIVEITPRPGSARPRSEYELDAIVFATGFDAMTGPLLGPDITGVDGVSLRRAVGRRATDATSDSPIAGFPNLFTITGPGSPSVLTNMMVSIEQHVEWVADCLDYLREQGATSIEATEEPRRVGRPRQRGRQLHAVPAGELVVHGRQRARQATGVHDVHRRASTCTARPATRSPPTATKASPSAPDPPSVRGRHVRLCAQVERAGSSSLISASASRMGSSAPASNARR